MSIAPMPTEPLPTEPLPTGEERYRLLFERGPVGILHFDQDGVIRACNDRFVDVMGSSREALTGFNMLRSLRNPGVRQAVVDAIAGRQGFYEGEYVSVTAGRRTFVRLLMFRVDHGAPPFEAIGLVEDVTEQKRGEHELRKVQSLLGTALDQTPAGVLVADAPDVRIRVVNGAAERILLQPSSQLTWLDARGSASWRCFRPEGSEYLHEDMPLVRTITHGEIFNNVEMRVLRHDGSERWVLVHGSPIRDIDGNVVAGIVVFPDITDRREAEQALRASEERFRLVAQQTGQIIYDYDIATGVIRWEGAIERIAGELPESFAGVDIEQWAERIHPHDRADALRLLDVAMQTVSPYRVEYRFRHADGTYRHMEDRGIFVTGATGKAQRILGVMADITARKHAEEAVRQTQKLESLGVLAGGIAHDFNNFLTAILGNVNIAQLKLSASSPATPYLENIEKAVLKAADLTKQMLAYSGRGRFVVLRHDLNQVVQETTHLLQVSISKKIAIRFHLARQLPPIEADAAQIQQVIMNLVTNASDAIGDNSGVIGIATQFEELDASMGITFASLPITQGFYVTLEVSDTGCGMAPDVQARIFDPFFSTKSAGRGLGL
ncbi:MAG: PAS domain S-box protein, partial [Myxococcales bacterium]